MTPELVTASENQAPVPTRPNTIVQTATTPTNIMSSFVLFTVIISTLGERC